MVPKKRAETQKSPDVARLLKSKSPRSPQELEPEAKKLCAQGLGTACAACLRFPVVQGAQAKAKLGWGCLRLGP